MHDAPPNSYDRDLEWVHDQPKVVLHDHLDGGIRPATLVELAGRVGYGNLPSDDPRELAQLVARAADSGSLEGYLSTFEHTTAVLQSARSLARVAREAVEDLAAQNVVYAELRFAPELHTVDGLTVPEAVGAVAEGLARGERSVGHSITARLVVCAMRSHPRVARVVDQVVGMTEPTVVGFDLAGAERGHPASASKDALDAALDAGYRLTLHAGEECGPHSVLDALECGASRIGHGVRLADQLAADGRPLPGSVAERVVSQQVPLEVCPSSNLHTGAYRDLASHPVDRLLRAGFAVTLNPDNRLVSSTSASDELARCAAQFGWGPSEAAEMALTAARSAFCDEETRSRTLRVLASMGVGGPTGAHG